MSILCVDDDIGDAWLPQYAYDWHKQHRHPTLHAVTTHNTVQGVKPEGLQKQKQFKAFSRRFVRQR
jgi:hypothetical protein